MTDRELMHQMYKLLLSEPLLAVCFDRLESMLRERLAQPEQEPVAWANLNELTEQFNSVNCGTVYRLPDEVRSPLYTSPPQRKPLTEEEIALISVECAASHQHDDIQFARAVIAKVTGEKE